MPLFGGKRDISMFRHINRELINKWIEQEVGIYQLALHDTEANLYGESDKKTYYRPLKCPALVGRDDQAYEGTEFGMDYNATATIAFLRDDLACINLVPKVGDVIIWDNEYFELDALIENQYFVGKNPDTDLEDESGWGWNVSLTFTAHITRRQKLNIVDDRGGFNPDDDIKQPEDK